MFSWRLRRIWPRLLLLALGTILGVALLVFLFRSVNLHQLRDEFANVNYWYLALATIPFSINLLVKVPRWDLLFGDEKPGWDNLFGAMNVGYAVNALLPARLGEIVRAYWIRDRTGISMVRTLSTIALERVTDGVALIILLLVTAPTVAFPRKLLGSALIIGILFVAILSAMILIAIFSVREEHPVAKLLKRMEGGRWPILAQAGRQVAIGLQALRSRRAIALLIAYTVLIWASNSVLIWLVLRSFHILVPLTAGVLLSAVLNLGMAVPSSPGYIGVFDYLVVIMLALYGIHRTPALAAALGFHAIAFIPVTVIGAIYVARAGWRMSVQLLRETTGQETAVPAAVGNPRL